MLIKNKIQNIIDKWIKESSYVDVNITPTYISFIYDIMIIIHTNKNLIKIIDNGDVLRYKESYHYYDIIHPYFDTERYHFNYNYYPSDKKDKLRSELFSKRRNYILDDIIGEN